MCGRGTFVFSNMDRFAGQFKDNFMHGIGTYNWNNGSTYQGSFERGKLCGKGKMTYSYGHVYVGGWKDNLWHGHGILTKRDHTKVTANWDYGSRLDGTVLYNPETIPEIYKGEYDENGLRSGTGEYTYTDGSRYIGKWESGRRHGIGTFFDRHGKKIYHGNWDDDRRSGEGTMWLDDGSVFKGQVEEGLMHGVGLLKYSDGRKYVGEFKKGVKDGKGEEHSANGVLIYYGTWSKGLRVGKGESILLPTKNGKRKMKLKVLRF